MSSIASTIVPLMIDGTSLWHPLYRTHVYNHLQSVFIVRNSNKARYFKHFMHGKAYTITIWRQWRKAWLLFFSYTKYSCSVIDRPLITPEKRTDLRKPCAVRLSYLSDTFTSTIPTYPSLHPSRSPSLRHNPSFPSHAFFAVSTLSSFLPFSHQAWTYRTNSPSTHHKHLMAYTNGIYTSCKLHFFLWRWCCGNLSVNARDASISHGKR